VAQARDQRGGRLLAVTRRRAEVFSAPGVHGLAVALARECLAVARAEGATIEDREAEAMVGSLAAAPPDLGSSILFDRLAGRPMEWDARNGVVVRLGARHGIPTPVSETIVTLLAALDAAPA
jgi:2-dehydropantoate 2-reductase